MTTPRSSVTARSSSGARRLGRMGNPPESPATVFAAACRSVGAARQGLNPAFRGLSALVRDSRMDRLAGHKELPVAHHDPIGLITPSCRACPAQRAFARYFSSNRRKLSRDRRARRLAEHLAADRGSAVAGLGAQRDGRPGTARPDLCAAHLGRPAADRTGPAVFRRCPDADRRPHRSRTAVDPEPARLRRPGAIGRGGAWRGADAAVRPDPRRRRGADRQIQFAAEAYRVRAAGTREGRWWCWSARTARSRTAC